MPTKDGLVICADKRTHYEQDDKIVKPDDDLTLKIQKLDDKTLFAIAGVRETEFDSDLRISGPGEGVIDDTGEIIKLPLINPPIPVNTIIRYRTKMNFERVIRNFYKDKDLTRIEDYWEDLLSLLKQNVGKIEYKFKSKPKLFQIPFYYLDSNKELKAGLYECYNDSSTGHFEINFSTMKSLVLLQAKPLPYGSPDLFNKLKAQANDEYNDLRNDPVLKLFLGDPQPKSAVSKQMALRFSKRLIAETSKRGLSINPEIHVSEICDCAILEPSGFRWTNENDEIEPKPPTKKPASKVSKKRK